MTLLIVVRCFPERNGPDVPRRTRRSEQAPPSCRGARSRSPSCCSLLRWGPPLTPAAPLTPTSTPAFHPPLAPPQGGAVGGNSFPPTPPYYGGVRRMKSSEACSRGIPPRKRSMSGGESRSIRARYPPTSPQGPGLNDDETQRRGVRFPVSRDIAADLRQLSFLHTGSPVR